MCSRARLRSSVTSVRNGFSCFAMGEKLARRVPKRAPPCGTKHAVGMDTDRMAMLEDPQLQPFLPLLYLAWADGELDGEERAAVGAHIAAQPWLRPAARQAVARWLDESDPPSVGELARLLAALRRIGETLSADARASLVGLAQALAARAGEGEAAVRVVAAALDLEPQAPAPAPPVAPPDPILVAALARAVDGAHADVRARVRAFLAEDDRRAYGLPDADYRALVLRWLRILADRGFGALAFPGVTTDGDLQPFLVAFETLAFGDLSLLVKFGVQFGLFGGSLFFLGSDRHRALLPRVARLDLLGCFAMSEVGHGSNVAQLETVA